MFIRPNPGVEHSIVNPVLMGKVIYSTRASICVICHKCRDSSLLITAFDDQKFFRFDDKTARLVSSARGLESMIQMLF